MMWIEQACLKKNTFYTIVWTTWNVIFNRPGVARAVLQTPLSFIHSLIQLVGDPFVQVSSKHLHTQTIWCRHLDILKEYSPPSTYQVSCVRCHNWRVSFYFILFFCDVVKLMDGGPVFLVEGPFNFVVT